MSPEKLSQAMAAVKEIALQVRNGNEPLAQSARRTLDELCWSPGGYPPAVTKALRDRGLRHTAS